MKVKFIALSLLALTALFIAPPGWSHTKVKTPTLEDGKIYQTLPDVIDLVFAKKVGLIALSLKAAGRI